MKTVTATIEGLSPILLNKFVESPTTKKAGINPLPREKAEAGVYRGSNGALQFTTASIDRLLRDAASGYKQGKKALRSILGAAVRTGGDEFFQLYGADGKPAKDFEVDSRSVVVPSTKGRIMAHRARLDQWSAKFELLVDEELVELPLVNQILVEGGTRIGVGDFRPQKGGRFGRFVVTGWVVS